MNKKKLIALLVSVGLVLVLVISGCTPAPEVVEKIVEVPVEVEKIVEKTVEVEKIVEVDKTYRVMNPLGEDQARELEPLAPRIDTLEGKHIAFCFAEGSPVIMPALWERLQKEFPTSTWVYTETRTTRPQSLTDEELVGVQAMIVGNAW